MDEPLKTGSVESEQRNGATLRAVHDDVSGSDPSHPQPTGLTRNFARKAKIIESSVDQSLPSTPSTPSAPSHSSRQQLVTLQAVISMACFAVTILNGTLPLYSKTVGAEGLDVGFLYALKALMTALPRPIIGRGIDRFGRKKFLLGGIVLIGISMLCFAYARTFTFELFGQVFFHGTLGFGRFMLYAGQILQGLGIGTVLLASLTMTADLAKSAGRGTSFGYTEQAQYRGGLLGAFVAVPIILIYGWGPQGVDITPEAWTRVFLIFAVVAALAFVFALRRVHDTHAIAIAHAERETQELGRINPQLYVLMAIIALTSASAYGLTPFVLRYIEDHITPQPELIALAYLPAAIVWGTLPSRMGRFADKFGRKPMMVVGLVGSAILSIFIPLVAVVVPPVNAFQLWIYTVPIALILLALFVGAESVTYSAATPAEQALASDMMGGKYRGRGFGLYTFARSLGEVVGPIIMGALYVVDPSGAFIANTVILILGSILVWFALSDPRGTNSKVASTKAEVNSEQ